MAAEVDYLSPLVRVFFRNSTRPEDIKDYDSLIKRDRVDWFHTSTEAEPRSAFEECKCRRFYEDRRSGKAAGYAEPWASAWGDHGAAVADRPVVRRCCRRACRHHRWGHAGLAAPRGGA
jgi:hypothetical protein